MDNTTSDNSDTVSATDDSLVTEDVQADTQTDSEVGNDVVKDDTFFDPTSLPAELVPAYKQMQGAFTKKTQEIAEQRKELEELRGKAAKADEYAKYESYLPIMDEMLAGGKRSEISPEMVELENQLKGQGYSDEAIEMMKVGAQFTLNQFNQREKLAEQSRVSERINGEIEKAQQVDPRLTDNSLTYSMADGTTITFGEIVAELVKADNNWTSDPVSATNRAIQRVDAMLSSAKVQGKQELSNSAMGRANRFTNVQASPRNASDNSQPQTIQEAAKAARAELGI